jgi:hypothetical protein
MENLAYSRKLDIAGLYDVVVAGGGPAGIAAAVSAARAGARTLLLERYGALGGNLTLGNISPILGTVARGTFSDEMLGLLAGAHPGDKEIITSNGREGHIDPDEAKGILTRVVAGSGARFHLQAPVLDVVKEGSAVKGVIAATPTGPQAFLGKVVIDATGDGLVSYLSGARCDVGRDLDRRVQPTTLEFTLTGVDESRAIFCDGEADKVTLADGRGYVQLCQEASKRGELPATVTIVRLHKTFYAGERNVNATQANGFDTLTLAGIASAEVELRAQVDMVVAFLRRHVPGYEACRVRSSASTLGVRETRRVMGDYVLTDRDVETGAKFKDVVVHDAWFLIDIHNPTGGGQAEGLPASPPSYDIPYRCLLPAGVDNLLTAGRCISGTHRAHASYRVMGICMAIGQASGTAAALAAAEGVPPRAVPAPKVQAALARAGVILVGS